MVKKTEMALIKVEINNHLKDRLLNQLSNINNVHIKSHERIQVRKSVDQKDPIIKKIKLIRQNLNLLFKKLDITESDFFELNIKKDQRYRFIASNLIELINQISEEINFYLNRLNELDRYSARAKIELENLKIIKAGYQFLEKYDINRESLSRLTRLNFKVYTTFRKNLENFNSLFQFDLFPNVHQTDEEIPNFSNLDDRFIFYIFYPKNQEEELRRRINIIHAEEIPILKKYLSSDGINFNRINNEMTIVNNTVIKYEKERRKIRDQNLFKFAALNEVVQNIEEYNWAEHQFESFSSDRSVLNFYIPIKEKSDVEQKLLKTFKKEILLEAFHVPKYEAVSKSEELEEINTRKLDFLDDDHSQKRKEQDFRSDAPTIMRNVFFLRPFEVLTKMYGTPSYSEIDPTPFLAITFPLLFGLMFGDIGHGFSLIIAGFLGGLIFYKRENTRNMSWIIFYCGIGATIWGFFYGEFFGSNEIFGYELNPIAIPIPLIGNVILHDPLDNILSIFMFTLFIGVIHINLGWMIQFLNYWKQHKKYLAFTDSFLKICFLTGGAILIFQYGINLDIWLSYPYPILLVLLPGIFLIILKPIGGLFGISYLREHSFGALFGEGTIETFETALSVLSNIASYIRLLALSLAHVALMISIDALLNLLPEPATITPGMEIGVIISIIFLTTGRIIGIIFGNLVVILLEGILVFINTIRLHFYEFFFKFYQGSGIEFFPFYLDDDYSIIQFRGGYEKDLIFEEIEKEIDKEKVKEDLDNAVNIIEEKFF